MYIFSIFQYISVTTEKNITPSCYINCTINYFSIEHSWLLDVSGHMNDEQMLTGWVIIIKLVSNYFKWHLGEEFIFFSLLCWRVFLLKHTIKNADLHITPKREFYFIKVYFCWLTQSRCIVNPKVWKYLFNFSLGVN